MCRGSNLNACHIAIMQFGFQYYCLYIVVRLILSIGSLMHVLYEL